jgi:low temperature requirement protein LtrA
MTKGLLPTAKACQTWDNEENRIHMNLPAHPLLRVRDGHEARVGYAELFFDLVYVFAVTQVSHFLLGSLSPLGATQALLLWFAVWLGWQYTCWLTNWFDPERPVVRAFLFAQMGVALVFAAALPDAFGERGMVVAGCYAVMQVGRSLFAWLSLRGRHPLAANYARILVWSLLSASLWLAGGMQNDIAARMGLWALAILAEYVAPMLRFPVPGLGRSDTRNEWTVEGGHMVERAALFVIVALGELILVTGASLAHGHAWQAPVLVAFAVAFVASIAMWWIYFNTGVHDASDMITRSDDPGRHAAWFNYVHVAIIAGVVVGAVGNELAIDHPDRHADVVGTLVLCGGPALFLLGNGLYKLAVYRRWPLSHLIGLGLLAVLAACAWLTDLLMVNGLATAALIVVAAWETRSRGPRRPDAHGVVD